MNIIDSYFNDNWVAREDHIRQVRVLLGEFPVVAVLGARQVGKTTLARQIADAEKEGAGWFDLEDPADLAQLEDPGLALKRYPLAPGIRTLPASELESLLPMLAF